LKLFKITGMEIIQLSQTYFCFELPSVLLKKELKHLDTSTMNIITHATTHRYGVQLPFCSENLAIIVHNVTSCNK